MVVFSLSISLFAGVLETFGIAYAVDVAHLGPALLERAFYQSDDPRAVVLRGVFWEKALSWGRDEGVADVGEDFGGFAGGVFD